MDKTLTRWRFRSLFTVPIALFLVFGIVGGNTAIAATASISPVSQTACKDQNVNWTLRGGSLAPYSYTFTYGDGSGGFHQISYSSSVSGGPHAFGGTQTYGQYLTVTDANNTTANAQSNVIINCLAP